MQTYTYQCTKCGRRTRSSLGTPPAMGCKIGCHSWLRITENMQTFTYQCAKCGSRKRSSIGTPPYSPCRAGGSHSWIKVV